MSHPEIVQYIIISFSSEVDIQPARGFPLSLPLSYYISGSTMLQKHGPLVLHLVVGDDDGINCLAIIIDGSQQ